MLIEEYFQSFQDSIESSPIVQSYQLDCDKRDVFDGFIRAEILLIDDSRLSVREFACVEGAIERDMYVYQYMDAEKALIFRYDNTPHHKKLNLPSFPHHKHNGAEDKVVVSSAPFLPEVLEEIERFIAD